MNKKLIFKVVLLLISLVLVISAINFFSSSTFRSDLNEFFADGKQIIKWCPDHVVDVQWADGNQFESLKNKYSEYSTEQFIQNFCNISADEILPRNDNERFEFKLLVKVQSAEAKRADLEQSSNGQFFRTMGIVFKSKKLTDQLAF